MGVDLIGVFLLSGWLTGLGRDVLLARTFLLALARRTQACPQ
jgi:hypothetical protein